MHVSTMSMVCMCISLLAGVGIFVGLLFGFKKKFKGSAVAFVTGCGTMFIFAFIIEQMVHTIVLSSGIGSTITGNIWFYGLYGAAMAALFEEIGRFLAFKTVLKKEQEYDANAFMYGAGHGGFEALYLLGMGMFSNLITAIMINSGNTEALMAGATSDVAAQVETVLATLTETAPVMYLIGIFERISAVIAQVAMTIPVWFAAKKGGKYTWLLGVSLLMHFLLDFIVVVASNYISSIMLIEGVIFVMAIIFALIAKVIWDKLAVSSQE